MVVETLLQQYLAYFHNTYLPAILGLFSQDVSARNWRWYILVTHLNELLQNLSNTVKTFNGQELCDAVVTYNSKLKSIKTCSQLISLFKTCGQHLLWNKKYRSTRQSRVQPTSIARLKCGQSHGNRRLLKGANRMATDDYWRVPIAWQQKTTEGCQSHGNRWLQKGANRNGDRRLLKGANRMATDDYWRVPIAGNRWLLKGANRMATEDYWRVPIACQQKTTEGCQSHVNRRQLKGVRRMAAEDYWRVANEWKNSYTWLKKRTRWAARKTW